MCIVISNEKHFVCCEGKERKKLFLAPDGQHVDGDDVDGSNGSGAHHIANEVLVISLGISNDCPGMLPEQKVCITVQIQSNLHYCFDSITAENEL